MIPNGNGGYVPQTRTCSVDFALGGYTPPALAAGQPARGGTTFNGVTTLAKFNQIQTSSAGVAQKIVFVDEAQNGVDDGCFGIYPVSMENKALVGPSQLPARRQKKPALSPLPTATQRFGDGAEAR